MQRPAAFQLQKTKIGEDHSEVLRDGADDLTLRLEEVDTLKECITVGDNFGTAMGGCRLARLLQGNA